MQSLNCLLIFIITVGLIGCAQLAKLHTTKPELSGVLLYNGLPVSGVRILSCAKGQLTKRCELFKTTTSDSQGRFFFESVGDFSTSLSLIGDSSHGYDIEFEYLGRKYHWNQNGLGDSPKAVDLRCEIRSEVVCTSHAYEP